MKRNQKIALAVLSVFLMAFYSCTDTEETTITGEVEFQFLADNENGSRITDIPDLSYILITLKGPEIYENLRLEIFKYTSGFISNNYYTKPITLKTGSYQITDFMVMDDNDEVVYAIPKESSAMGQFIDDPLPIYFGVFKSKKTVLETEVLALGNLAPEQFGYMSLNYDLVLPFRLSVFGLINSGNSMRYDFLDPMMYVYYDPETLNIQKLAPAENLIKTNGQLSIYHLWLEKHGYKRFDHVFDRDSLIQHAIVPLSVYLEPAITIESNNLNSLILDTRWVTRTFDAHFGYGEYNAGSYTINNVGEVLPNGQPFKYRCFVSITGPITGIYGISLENDEVTKLDISNATYLQSFKLINSKLDSLNLSPHYSLRDVIVTGNPLLSKITIHPNNRIRELVLSDNNFDTSSIDEILQTMYASGDVNGDALIDVRNNQPPSGTGLYYIGLMESEYGWEILYDLP